MSKEPEFLGLHTMLPKDVHDELTEYAKSFKTFSGSWDYGIAIRELLKEHNQFNVIQDRIDAIETIVLNLNDEHKRKEVKDKEVVPTKTEREELNLLG